ncbi:hypothetical protein MCAG_05289 [Micromonospora sp. ATCC 39149]|uniref:GXWXG domain-containing protein n=1 Tax=Micromonospora carbonacea TaxID=47853 RepID=A0A7D6CG98_9ACTN|nr:GXWXG domain-containing protein [Micromonospora sp. ATCC 39149]EEP74962.1 hypothetical protein MCAG_05289 [Micromonospora sp. ATCC 39149]QLK00713.1 GXWXG domain-containing protein [Micromonospora carbonacea]
MAVTLCRVKNPTSRPYRAGTAESGWTHHPMERLLERSRWHGKRFESPSLPRLAHLPARLPHPFTFVLTRDEAR